MTMKKYVKGYTCGVFDLFHTGHLNLLERCKSMCEFLIVGVCDDDYVRNVKHTEPVIPENDRVRILKALRCVDDAVLIDTETTNDKMLALERFGFNVLFSGDDWKGTERYRKTEEQFAEYVKLHRERGGKLRIEYLPYTHGISTTSIKERLKAERKLQH